jgi:hypothetical protein
MYERYVLMNYIGYTLVVLAVMAAELTTALPPFVLPHFVVHTPAGPLVKEAGLRPANSLLSNRHRRYATRAYGLPLGHPIGDGIRNPSIDKSIFGNLSKTAKDGVDICHSGQDVIEYTWIPACIERIAVPLIIESRDKAERSAAIIEEESTRCIWTDGSRDELGNVGAAAVWRQGNQ